MPKSVTGISSKQTRSFYSKHSGFTLIEILISLAIISIILSAAVLASGDFGESRRIENSVREFVRLLHLVSEQAILTNRVYGLAIEQTGYRFYQLHIDPKTNLGRWQLVDNDRLLRYRPIKNIPWNLSLQGKNPFESKSGPYPHIVIFSNGSLTPFVLRIGEAGQYRIQGSENGHVSLQKS